ncbi:6-phosphogluconate dehydrogenase C-terminal domain-like protein [Plenodomus tracheiphilus IPT5]|uniref:6-phosphogluconate dehydrogenase C-terminal domain-like protein n=1 Tax=Plenodomus tracheiphilus IPT5 TaxID=1408161 RepID=A0A6A7BNG4_9PLEO|nr:6-phosphogluconate dehydrogenase C-terminal domain-like protein [Plenodomus tracheiphilus IPT5]
MSPPNATIAILSIGQMGLGIAHLLKAHNYHITTNISSRSPATHSRASAAGITLLPTDEALVADADYILSIVPPRDALATAKRIQVALAAGMREKKTALWYVDLNAISPSTARRMCDSFRENAPGVVFVDGGIIGGPPIAPTTQPPSSTSSQPTPTEWSKPDIPLSGPSPLTTAPISGPHLAQTLNANHLDENIGSASGLKCCFASLTKGFIALSLQSYTTASSLNVLPALQSYLDVYNPGARTKAEKGIVGCTGKAYRWVEEMRQIGETFGEEGGWEVRGRVFREIAGVFEGLAEGVERGGGDRGELGSVEGVVGVLGRGLKEKRE